MSKIDRIFKKYKANPEIFENAGVKYSHDYVEGWLQVCYRLIHLSTGKEFFNSVYVLERDKVNDLLMHWNRANNWKVIRL